MATQSKQTKTEIGRPEFITTEDLSRRYREWKYFLESQWGRIGFELRRVRKPDKVLDILKLVPRIEQWAPFRDQPSVCFLENGEVEIEKSELDLLSRRYEDADDTERALWSEYLETYQKAEAATTALKSAISQFGDGLTFIRFFWVICLTARELRVEKLTSETNRIKAALGIARETKQLLQEQLIPRRAWFARSQVVKFRKSTRFEKSAGNFAKAMAGLPEYGWLHSFRKCSKIKDVSEPATSLRLFEILERLVKQAKTINLGKLEMRFRDQLLNDETDLFVRGYVGPNWSYMRLAFAECRKKGYKRAELPYRIMGRFLDHLERPKSIAEVELAKLEQLG